MLCPEVPAGMACQKRIAQGEIMATALKISSLDEQNNPLGKG